MPFPAYAGNAEPTAILGGTSMGFYITRRAWEDTAKRDAVISLLAKLTSEDAKRRLGHSYGGALLESVEKMIADATQNNALIAPLQEQMDPDARLYWFGQIAAIIEGTADPLTVLSTAIEMGAFR